MNLRTFILFFIKGTKTGDTTSEIEACLIDADFVPLQLRSIAECGRDDEEVAEEQENISHETSTSDDQKATSLFYCPVEGCLKTFLRSSTLQHHVLTGDHVIHPERENMYERAKQGYAKRLEEGFKANLTLETKFELYPGQNKLNQGWALKSCKSRSPFSEKQKEFLDEIFKEGKQTGVKANPDTVVLTTRKARNDQNKHLLQVSKGLISQQVASYFGRKKASQNPKVANRQQYPCYTCVKYNLNMKTKEKLLRMSTKEMHSIGNIPVIMANIASTTLFKGRKNGAQKSPEARHPYDDR